MAEKVKVVFVCLGNICRSPTAHAVMRAKVRGAGLSDLVEVDSCGTANYHEGNPPDKRSRAAAENRGYSMQGLYSRPLCAADYLLAMDSSNLRNLRQSQPVGGGKADIGLLMDYASGEWPTEVPDPYYGGDQGFENVLTMIEAACDGLILEIQNVKNKKGLTK